MNRLTAVAFFALCCASCGTPKTVPDRTNQGGPAGIYRFSTADLTIDLVLKPDRTYYVSMESWARTGLETGTWNVEGPDVLLAAIDGQLPLPIHRLQPDHQGAETFLRIVDPESPAWMLKAIVFRRTAL